MCVCSSHPKAIAYPGITDQQVSQIGRLTIRNDNVCVHRLILARPI